MSRYILSITLFRNSKKETFPTSLDILKLFENNNGSFSCNSTKFACITINNSNVWYLKCLSEWKFTSWEWILPAKNSSKLRLIFCRSDWLNLNKTPIMTSVTNLSSSRPVIWLNKDNKGWTDGWKTSILYGMVKFFETWLGFNTWDKTWLRTQNPHLCNDW